jgi:hypothetical protein
VIKRNEPVCKKLSRVVPVDIIPGNNRTYEHAHTNAEISWQYIIAMSRTQKLHRLPTNIREGDAEPVGEIRSSVNPRHIALLHAKGAGKIEKRTRRSGLFLRSREYYEIEVEVRVYIGMTDLQFEIWFAGERIAEPKQIPVDYMDHLPDVRQRSQALKGYGFPVAGTSDNRDHDEEYKSGANHCSYFKWIADNSQYLSTNLPSDSTYDPETTPLYSSWPSSPAVPGSPTRQPYLRHRQYSEYSSTNQEEVRGNFSHDSLLNEGSVTPSDSAYFTNSLVSAASESDCPTTPTQNASFLGSSWALPVQEDPIISNPNPNRIAPFKSGSGGIGPTSTLERSPGTTGSTGPDGMMANIAPLSSTKKRVWLPSESQFDASLANHLHCGEGTELNTLAPSSQLQTTIKRSYPEIIYRRPILPHPHNSALSKKYANFSIMYSKWLLIKHSDNHHYTIARSGIAKENLVIFRPLNDIFSHY